MKTEPKPRRTFLRLLTFIHPLGVRYMVAMVLLVMLLAGERLFTAYILKNFVDSITFIDIVSLWRTVAMWLAFVAFFVGGGSLLFYQFGSMVVRVTANLRQRLFSHLQRLPLGFHEARHSGDMLSVMTNDIGAAEKAYADELPNLANATMQGISATIFMLFLNWKLALVVIASGLAPLVINAVFAKPLRKIGDKVQANLGVVSERLSDLLAGFNVVRTFNLAEWVLERFGNANTELLANNLKRARLEAALAGANGFGGLFFFIPFGVGAWMVFDGQTTFGTLIGLTQLNNQINYFVYSLGGTITRLQSALAAADRVLNIVDAPVEPERYGVHGWVLEKARSDTLLEFCDVSFGYEETQEVIKGLQFGVKTGEVAAFVGPSGSGKSTIFKLLLGCYPVSHGTIFIQGKSLQTTRLSEVRDLFSYIPQDAYLYTGSIMENIRYGKPNASDEQVIAAAQAANAHDFVTGFPDGYHTLVGERGARLSGGQRQRIAIARALLKDAPILLLDEATSALDSESEELVQRALGVLMKGRTVLVIAHRLSTIEKADVIFALDGGCVVEQGTHDELMAMQGLYHRLHALQFQGEELKPETAQVR